MKLMTVLKPMYKTVKFTLKLGGKTVLAAAEAPFWLGLGVKKAVQASADAARAGRSMRGGVLHCPRGHEIPLEGGIYECATCGFVYEGSILRCPNPECQARVTAYVNCPTCGLSVRNPYRWGRP